jgi:hypothetical protein
LTEAKFKVAEVFVSAFPTLLKAREADPGASETEGADVLNETFLLVSLSLSVSLESEKGDASEEVTDFDKGDLPRLEDFSLGLVVVESFSVVVSLDVSVDEGVPKEVVGLVDKVLLGVDSVGLSNGGGLPKVKFFFSGAEVVVVDVPKLNVLLGASFSVVLAGVPKLKVGALAGLVEVSLVVAAFGGAPNEKTAGLSVFVSFAGVPNEKVGALAALEGASFSVVGFAGAPNVNTGGLLEASLFAVEGVPKLKAAGLSAEVELPNGEGVALLGVGKDFLLADGPSSSSSLSNCLFLLLGAEDSLEGALNVKGEALSLVAGVLNENGLGAGVSLGFPNEKAGVEGLSVLVGALKENEGVAGFSVWVDGVLNEKVGAGLSVEVFAGVENEKAGMLLSDEPVLLPKDPNEDVLDLSESDIGLLKVKGEGADELDDLLDPTDEILDRLPVFTFSVSSVVSLGFPNMPNDDVVDSLLPKLMEGVKGVAVADNCVLFSVGLDEPNEAKGEGFSAFFVVSSESFLGLPSEFFSDSLSLSFSDDLSMSLTVPKREGFSVVAVDSDEAG